ncbi:eukaryotic translation initiation factor 4G-like [Phragmites australis]|uniref:eukaryotic translation initiation factor 4G-like n=1 Tax=Phragmites australis TaxID=29695 RepID=UPI002D780E66|nr:eukaryotic translation initiation factor 4G-like [Phragmites australis]
MYRNQFRSDRLNDHATAARRPGRGSAGGTHRCVVSGGRGSAAPAARPRSPPFRSGRPGSVQQEYRPRSPAGALTQGNATTYAPSASAAAAGHTEPMSQASFGSLDNVKPSNVPAQSDVLSSVSAEGTWVADSSSPTVPTKGYSSTAFTLQFGTFSPGVINKQCTSCTSSVPPDQNGKKHEKAHWFVMDHHGLSDKPYTVSSSPAQEQQKLETTDDLVIGGQTDLIDKCENVHVPELHEKPMLNSVPPPSKVCTDSCKVLPRTPSSPTQQQCQNQEERKETINASRSDTLYKYPATKPKITVQIPAPYTPNISPPQFMLPVPGRPLPVAFQQKQPHVPVEFGGPGLQMQPIGSVSSSLPVKMAVPVGNAPHIRPLFVHGAQPRALHQQTFIHQGQGFGCAPPANCHIPQFGNMRIAQELSQQQPRSGDEQKRTIKITHPETHEELILDRRGHSFMGVPASGQMPLYNINELPQPVQSFSPLQKVYYPRPGTYNSAPIYLPNTTTIPLSSRQTCSKMQPSMHSFDSTNSNQPITSIRPPMPISWLDASSRPPISLHTASEVSSFKGRLPSCLSAPVQVKLKPPIAFPAEKNEVSSETSMPTCVAETRTTLKYCSESAMSSQQSDRKIGLQISPEPAKLVCEGNLKVPVATFDISCNSISQAVPTQQVQTGQASADHVTSIEGPQTIPTSNLSLPSTASCTSSVKGKPIEMEESPVIPTTSSSHAKYKSSHTEASSRTDSVILIATSLCSNTDGTSLTNRNSKYDGNSILGKPPLIYTQEMLPPKFAGSSTFTEGLRKAKVNPDPFLEKDSEVNGSIPLQNLDFMIEEHVANDKAMCSKSKTEQVDATTPGAACGLEDDTDVAKSVRFHSWHESVDLLPSVSIDDLQTSNENKQPSSDAYIVTSESESKQNYNTIDSARDVINATLVSNSISSQKNMGQESIDSEISNPCSTAAASMVQIKKVVLESAKAKSTYGRKKKRKEMLPKSTGQKYSDLDSASSSLNENVENFNTSEDVQSSLTTDVKQKCTLDAEQDSSTGGNDIQNRTDLFDWEDVNENSTEKLEVFGSMHSDSGAEVNKDEFVHKKYSRDFLLTFEQSCIELPAGFKIGFDISEAVMSVHVGAPFIANSELNPNHERIKDRVSATSRVNRHMAGKFDDDKWRKQFPSPVSGRDSLVDNAHRPSSSSWDALQRAGHRSTRSLLQNQPFSQYSGEMLSRAMKVVTQRSMSRGSVDERWQHRTNVQGISSPSHVSMPLMHKAEKKYEIGKVSDEEEAKQRQLKAILNKLTPQNFDKLFAQVKELNIDNVVTLTGVISQIFDKALMEPTFCEMYASFCSRLAGDLPNFVEDDEKITFKRLLLNKCQEEFERGEREQAEADKVDEEGGTKQSEDEREEKRIRARRRMLGNIRLIGELYKKKMLTERIMHECINKLLGEYQNPDEEDLEALCKLMSTIGEMIDHPRSKVHMDFYFDLIQKLSENSTLSSRIRFMLEDVIDLRKNKWRQRRKVEGPKKIEEVRRDAAKQKLVQSTRFGSSPNYNSSVTCINSGLRPGPPSDNSMRGSSALTSRGSSQVRTYGSQNVNLDARYQPSNRASPVPLHQRRADKSIHLGPQGNLGRGMSLRGKPPVLPEVPLNSRHGQTSQNSREGSSTGAASNRTNLKASTDAPTNQSWGTVDHDLPSVSTVDQMYTSSMIRKEMCAEAQTFPEEVLQEKSILTIKEFYSAKDEKEVTLCMKELNAPSFYPSLVSLWINDSFERKDLERELLAKLLVDLCKSQDSLLSQMQLLQGFQHVLSTLEDAVTDAPKATEFLGRIFAKFILEDVISLTEIGGLLQERDGGEEPAGHHHALDDNLASEVLGSMLESIRVERGDTAVDEIRAKSNLQYFRRPGVCI